MTINNVIPICRNACHISYLNYFRSLLGIFALYASHRNLSLTVFFFSRRTAERTIKPHAKIPKLIEPRSETTKPHSSISKPHSEIAKPQVKLIEPRAAIAKPPAAVRYSLWQACVVGGAGVHPCVGSPTPRLSQMIMQSAVIIKRIIKVPRKPPSSSLWQYRWDGWDCREIAGDRC
jgi:hypothetical protein